MHRDFCSIADDDPNQIHFCWWFLAWHRAYISVTERKIRQISGDDSFTYPYWNWSSDRTIPDAYARPGSSLANAIRQARSSPIGLTDGEVGYRPDDPVLKKLGVVALGSKTFEAKNKSGIKFSFGGIARPNPQNTYDNNQLEATPHGPVHNYVGGGGDMSDFETAARDPIFFAHHGNLDRLWETWRAMPGHKATEPQTDAFMNHSFVSTWLDGTPVEVAMSDILDTTKLGYTYDYTDVFRPNQPLVMAQQAAPDRLPPIATQQLSIPLTPQGADEGSRKYLEITGVAAPETLLTVSVHLKAANAPPSDTGIEVGTFAAVKNGGKIAWPSDTLVFDITEAVKRFGGQQTIVLLIPQRIGSAENQRFDALKYDKMQIITQQP
jgi:polyphenol oxidase